MTDDITVKRAFVADLYSGPGWKKQVQQMPDAQVIAIYLREHERPRQDKPKESGDDDIPL